MGTLDRYRARRDFARTPEPPPHSRAASAAGHAARFVVQKHDASRLHYDLRLEMDGVLKSWAVTRGPSLDPSQKRLAVETEDHPLNYATFEGTIPEDQYGGGTVMLWDEGTWQPVDGKEADEGLARGSLTFELFGARLRGRWHLQRLRSRDGRAPQWLLIKVRDAVAREAPARDITNRYARSVATGRTMSDIARGRPAHRPKAVAERASTDSAGEATGGTTPARGAAITIPAFVPPMLCRTRTAPPSGGDWLAEVKYDGYRALLRAADGAVTLTTRGRKDWTARFPAIAAEADALSGQPVMLDGEIVVFDGEGRTQFGALQAALRSADAADAVYVAFDCLFADGEDLRERPIEERKERAKALVAGRRRIVYGDHVGPGRQHALFEEARALGLEGIVAKRAGSRYRSGRHDAWLKVRAVRAGRFVVGGYTRSAARGLGALLVGAYDGASLRPMGRVGTGFTATEASALLARLEERRRAHAPFCEPVAGRGVRFVEPELVVWVDYLDVTRDGRLRHPVFRRLADGPAEEVGLPSGHPAAALDRPGTPAPASRAHLPARARTAATRARAAATRARADTFCGVTLTNPDRILFPEQAVTKAALAQHYVAHAERMLPHVAGRPLSLVRCPQGRGRTCFFQRHPATLAPQLGRDIGEDDGPAIVVQSAADLIELVQKGVLEIHLRGARADRPDRPDRLVFDLDPGEGVPFAEVKAAAVTVRETLARLDLQSFVKTTGGKGLHVMVPIERRTSFAQAKAWARHIAATLADAEPGRFLISMARAKRHGRIFIDYLRNDRKASAVAPYSTRARPGAPFAVPLSWEGLADLASPAPLHVGEVAQGDPWAGVAAVRQRLSARHLRPVRERI